jgi:hypothetical protein
MAYENHENGKNSRMFEHLPSHAIQLVLHLVEHRGMGVLMQQDDAFDTSTWTVVPSSRYI